MCVNYLWRSPKNSLVKNRPNLFHKVPYYVSNKSNQVMIMLPKNNQLLFSWNMHYESLENWDEQHLSVQYTPYWKNMLFSSSHPDEDSLIWEAASSTDDMCSKTNSSESQPSSAHPSSPGQETRHLRSSTCQSSSRADWGNLHETQRHILLLTLARLVISKAL